ncbi:hypothetical protein BDZ94DRAFT_1266827 [Collybia nuda]|uniref:Uncharacterized protein n=1 Tax=Collybia nuda TaxID=64659 RepID=A0A9P5Y285_9AGAR|nr:hypothetical protein BDZ94DRAFT_1266827 [Collybia nuda]
MSGVKAVPAPWELKGRTWLFILPSLSKTASFPAGFSAPHEADVLTAGGEFVGGPGSIQVVSYTDSPVGPYDELVYTPGRWKYADGSFAFRITRIYVSSKESTENGRRNWNIPKQVAVFDIGSGKDGVTTITVSHPGSRIPFFKVSVKPIPVLSRLPIPLNTRLLGKYFTLMQPPLPAGNKTEEVETTRWASMTPVLTGTSRLVSVTPLLDGKVGDGAGYPAVAPWTLGACTDPLALDFRGAVFSDSV